MQRTRIRTVRVTIIVLGFLVLNGLLTNAHSANGIKLFAEEKTEKIFYTQAYLKDGASFSDIYCMNPDGTEPIQITDFYLANASEAMLSYDGKYLYFTSNFQAYKSAYYEDVFKLEFAGLKLTRITGEEYVSADKTGSVGANINDDTGLGISADQILLSFQGSPTYYNAGELVKNQQPLQNVPATKVWVKAVMDKFVGSVGYVTVSADKKASVNLTLSDGNFLAYSPSGSPDGSKIAGITGHAFYDYEMKLQGKSPNIILTNLTVWDAQGKIIDQQQNSLIGDAYPQYSPDGSKIAYTRGTIGQESIVVVPSNSLNAVPQVIAAGGYDIATLQSFGYSRPRWSPDGTKIACAYIVSSSGGMTGNLVLLNSDGSGNKTQLTTVPQNAAAIHPAFSPDGESVAYALITSKGSILYLTDIMTNNFTSNIYLQRISGGDPVKLTTDDRSAEPCWGTIGPVTQPGNTTTTTPGGTKTTTIPGGTDCPTDWPIPCTSKGNCCSADYPTCCVDQNPRLKNMCCTADYPYCGHLGKHCYKEPPGMCATTLVAHGDPDALKTLRRLRDDILQHTDKGKHYKALFYKHSPELITILSANKELMEQAENVLYWMLPSIESFVAQHKITVTEDMQKELLNLCESFNEKASPELRATIKLLESDLVQGNLFDEFGKIDPASLKNKKPHRIEAKDSRVQ